MGHNGGQDVGQSNKRTKGVESACKRSSPSQAKTIRHWRQMQKTKTCGKRVCYKKNAILQKTKEQSFNCLLILVVAVVVVAAPAVVVVVVVVVVVSISAALFL